MELISTHMCKEGDCGYHGNLFGGLMLAWLDESAVAYACQLSDTPRMQARRYSVYNGTERVVCQTNIKFVRIDGDGEAIPIAEHVKNRHAQ